MIPTAADFLHNQDLKIPHNRDRSGIAYPDWHCEERMIEFAKLHIEYIRSLQMAKYNAGQSGYIIRKEWEEIIENIK